MKSQEVASYLFLLLLPSSSSSKWMPGYGEFVKSKKAVLACELRRDKKVENSRQNLFSYFFGARNKKK
jgi:hypothetical protein